MATTRSRPRGREQARPPSGGVAAEHATKIYAVAIVGIVVIVAFLALTSTGHVIDAATQHFMLFYAGVFALIALCASTGLGLIATDRVFLHAGHRVLAQSAHRAASFGAVTFLIIHIVTEILAQRVHVLDAVVPFLSPFRTFYIGLGTIASDLILLVFITGIMRGRFNAHGKAWRWRAIHYTAYASFVFGIWHGLLAGRPGQALRGLELRAPGGAGPARARGADRRQLAAAQGEPVQRRRWTCRRAPPPPRCAPRPCSPSSAWLAGRTPAARTVSWSPRCRSRRCPRRSAEAMRPVRC